MSWLSQLVFVLSPRRSGFVSTPFHVGFVVETVALGQVFTAEVRVHFHAIPCGFVVDKVAFGQVSFPYFSSPRQYLPTNDPYSFRYLLSTLYNRRNSKPSFSYLKEAYRAVIARHTSHNVSRECTVNCHLSATSRLQLLWLRNQVICWSWNTLSVLRTTRRWLATSVTVGVNDNWMGPQQQNAGHADVWARNNAYVMCLILLKCTNISLQIGIKSMLLFHGKSLRAVWWIGTASHYTAIRTSGTPG
jgi:hypothetical protein